jgi:phage tail sheath protein FI
VTFKKRSTDGMPVVVSDNTCAMRGSDYQTLQVLRIANTASHLVKIVMTPFLGEPNNVEARTAMKTNLTTALDKMVDAGALLGGNGNGYQFTISSDPVETILGQITVTLFLRPALQIKWVNVVVNVTQ